MKPHRKISQQFHYNNLNYICSETLADEIRITPYNSLEKVEEMELTEGVFTRIELLKR